MASARRAPDHFTRFTSTTPHAASYQAPRSSPSFASSNPSIAPNGARPSPPPKGPPGETPAQKVARLRAAHRAAQEAASYSAMDRVISTGRVVADKLHRATAYTLMGITVIAGGLSVYSFFSLIRHHRRQKRAWIESELQRLSDAQTAFLHGEATAEQLHVLEQERAGEEMQLQREEEKRLKKANSLFGRAKRALYRLGGVEEEDRMGDKARKGEFAGIMNMVREKEQNSNRLLSEGTSYLESSEEERRGPRVVEAIEKRRRMAEKETSAQADSARHGGMLDQMANNTFQAATSSSKSWWNWGGKS